MKQINPKKHYIKPSIPSPFVLDLQLNTGSTDFEFQSLFYIFFSSIQVFRGVERATTYANLLCADIEGDMQLT